MNVRSSEHPIPGPGRSAPKLSRTISHVLTSRLEMKAAVVGVLRERRRHTTVRPATDGFREQEAVEAEIIALLYGDAGVRRRAFDTQSSHVCRRKIDRR